jgi:26S proteasome regulatory subunit T2
MRCNLKVKTWGWNLEQAVANSTLATFLRVVGNELIQKYLGDGPSWCEISFVLLMSFPHPLSIDEIDAVGTKR